MINKLWEPIGLSEISAKLLMEYSGALRGPEYNIPDPECVR